jgi:hypothetical protein
MTYAPRQRLLGMLHRTGVRLVVSGHEHQSCDRMIDGIRYVWVPAVAFRPSHERDWCRPDLGVAVFTFAREMVEVSFKFLPGLKQHNAAEIKKPGGYRFLRDMPDDPPPFDRTRSRMKRTS